MSNPVDEYLEMREGSTKVANQLALPFMKGEAARRALSQVGSGALQAAGALGVVGLVGAAQKAYDAISKKRDYDEMIKANPDLIQERTTNPRQFEQHYKSLRRMNPRFARDPVVSGNLMRSMSLNPQTAGGTIVESLRNVPSGPEAEIKAGPVAIRGIGR